MRKMGEIYHKRFEGLGEMRKEVQKILEAFENFLEDTNEGLGERWITHVEVDSEGVRIYTCAKERTQEFIEKVLLGGHKFRKWEAIALFCRREGYEQAEKLANAIDKLLLTLYDDYQHDEQYQVRVPAEDCEALALDGEKCPGCVHVIERYGRRDCSKCAFGREYGICIKKNSIFSVFIKTLREEASE